MANRPAGQNFIQETDGNPNGVVTGALNALLRDWNTELIYVCTSNPTGTAWALHTTQTVLNSATAAAAGVGGGAVADGSITNAKLADMATKTYKGRTAAGTGAPADVPVATLKTDLALVKADVGLGNVDNTTDAGKPVSTAQQAAIDLKGNAELFKCLTAGVSGGNVNTAQPWFPSAGAVAVEAATTYFIEGVLAISRAAGAVSHTTGILFGGTATLTSIAYEADCNVGQTMALLPISGVFSSVATLVSVKAASTTTTEQIIITLRGVVRIANAGTFIPQFQYSAAPGGVPTILANTYFRLWKVGSNVVASNGVWS